MFDLDSERDIFDTLRSRLETGLPPQRIPLVKLELKIV